MSSSVRSYLDTPKEMPDAPWVAENNPLPVAEEDDNVIRPPHYAQFEIEPIEFIMRNNLPFWKGNIIKYVMRSEMKNGLEDLKKARRYLDMRINQLEGKDVL